MRAAVNLPLGAESALRLSANANSLKGVEYDALTGVQDLQHDLSARARLLTHFSDAVTLNLIADYDHTTQNYGDPEFTI